MRSKVPAVTLGFWVIKVLATTLGETGGDAVTMSAGLGYLAGTAIFAAILIVLVIAQIRASHFNRYFYWAVVIATTTAGTTLADFCDRSLGIGYVGGATILLAGVLLTLFAWYHSCGAIEADNIVSPKVEVFYWVTIMFSQTLGTALGDFAADPAGLDLGYDGGALLFGTLLAVVAALYFATRLSKPALFWAAFILTRPLGATVGDFLDKPAANGGLNLDRYGASAALAVAILMLIVVLPQRAGGHPGAEPSGS